MKHLFFPLILAFCFLSHGFSQNHSSSNHLVYYSTIAFVETPLSYMEGSIPLEGFIAKTRNHYRFAYNSKNQLKSVSFYNGETPRDPNHTANLFTLAHQMTFEYSGTQETISFYDTKGAAVAVLGNVYRFVYQLNELGFRASLTFEDQNGNQIENAWSIYNYQWEYQADGSVIEDRFDQEGKGVSIRPGFEFYRLRLFFNPKGHIALMQNIDQNGSLVENPSGASQDQILTNKEGNFLQWQVLNNQGELEKGNGPNVAIGIQKFNEYGYEIELAHRDENDHPLYSAYGICKSKTTFDKYGNLSERRFYNESDQAAGHQIAAYHLLKISWDKTGNRRTALRYYGPKDQPTLHRTRGYHAVQYIYNQDQKLSKISYLDIAGNLCNRKDNGIAYIQYTYDQQSGKGKRMSFNKNHQIL